MKLFNRLNNIVTPFDLWTKRANKKHPGIRVGWCSYFPPFSNGVAAATYFSVKELQKNPEVNLCGIPLNNRMDKSIFSGLSLAALGDKNLEAIIFFSLGLNFANILRRSKTKSIAWQTIHFGPERFKAERGLINQLKRATLVVALNRWAQNEYLKNGIERVEYAPHGVDTAYFVPISKTSSRPEILFVSRMHYWKGINVFLEMIPAVLSKIPECVFRMHAPPDKHSFYYQEIKETLKQARKKYKDNLVYEDSWVDYLGIRDCYKNADILVFPSHCEGFGIPVIEALSCGIPCIVADTPPMNEIILDGITGFCLAPDKKNVHRYHGLSFPSPEALAEKAIYLLTNDAVREKMGKSGRERVKTEYELIRCMDKLVSCVKQVSKNE